MKIFLGILIALFALFLLYLFLIKPRRRRKETAPFANASYAHRGLWGEDAPENSLAAFRRAIEAGVGIELDVQLSADGEVMVFHDESLLRMTGTDASLYGKDLAALKALTLGESGEAIPTLREVLSLVAGRVPLLVEIKSDHAWREVCERTAAILDGYAGAYLIESFHPLAVAWFRKHRPRVVRGQLSARLMKEKHLRKPSHFLVQNLLLNVCARPDFIAYDLHDTDVLSFRLSRLFRPYTFAWTVKSEADFTASASFDSVIFEEGALPSVLEKQKEKGNTHDF